MDDKKLLWRELLILLLGELLGVAAMLGVYALLHRLDWRVLCGAGIGLALAVLNYFLMAVSVWRAADKAEQGDVAGGRRVMSLSQLGRYALMLAVVAGAAWAGFADPIAMLVPLVLAHLILILGEFFRKKGVNQK